ncbi:hypothetical protein PoB_004390400, partial [Plakobranchus ocellatus]
MSWRVRSIFLIVLVVSTLMTALMIQDFRQAVARHQKSERETKCQSDPVLGRRGDVQDVQRSDVLIYSIFDSNYDRKVAQNEIENNFNSVNNQKTGGDASSNSARVIAFSNKGNTNGAFESNKQETNEFEFNGNFEKRENSETLDGIKENIGDEGTLNVGHASDQNQRNSIGVANGGEASVGSEKYLGHDSAAAGPFNVAVADMRSANAAAAAPADAPAAVAPNAAVAAPADAPAAGAPNAAAAALSNEPALVAPNAAAAAPADMPAPAVPAAADVPAAGAPNAAVAAPADAPAAVALNAAVAAPADVPAPAVPAAADVSAVVAPDAAAAPVVSKVTTAKIFTAKNAATKTSEEDVCQLLEKRTEHLSPLTTINRRIMVADPPLTREQISEVYHKACGLTPARAPDGQATWKEGGVLYIPKNVTGEKRFGKVTVYNADFEPYVPYNHTLFFEGRPHPPVADRDRKIILARMAGWDDVTTPSPLRACPDLPCLISTDWKKYARTAAAISFN